jgi:hypothetical protein
MSWRAGGLLLVTSMLVSPTAPVAAAPLDELPQHWRYEGQLLVRNGAGVRQYGLLRWDIYLAALYLPARESDPQRILDGPGPKVVHMRFLRSASREDTLKAWRVYLERNCSAPCVMPAAALQRFEALVPATQSADVQTYYFDPSGVSMDLNATPLGRVEDAAFARILLATWIGEHPTSESLKRALLGIPP